METQWPSARSGASVALVVPESAVFRFSFADFGDVSHPMPTLRAYITHDLLRASGILEPSAKLIDLVYSSCSDLEKTGWTLESTHLTDALLRASGGSTDQHSLDLPLVGAGEDNPIGPGVFDYSRAIVAASVTAAECLNAGYKVAINWSGGMHHACHNKMLGFCYLNDISAAMKVLLRRFNSVLYIDIDVHHGDGVENDWVGDNRVTTLSIHYYDGLYFPTTGYVPIDIGPNGAIRVNLPMAGNLADHRFTFIMKQVVDLLVRAKHPDCVVLQSGADSLAGDPLGFSNISGVGHASIVTLLKGLDIPLLLLGGGGYNMINVPRVWAIETAIATGVKLPPWSVVERKCSPLIRMVMDGIRTWVVPNFNVIDSNTSKTVDHLLRYVQRKVEEFEGKAILNED
eukprot:GHVH01006739.1.p1 GENE.GHVH01006739.1~~GHVH01006739.1.p1  ORF type:complete len:400 (+),score=55.09 GHVH01006739.1:50-1249(+)